MSVVILDDGRRHVSIDVPGLPQPQGSKTIRALPGGGARVREDNPETAPWRHAVAAAARAAMGDHPPLGGPLLLDVTFRFPRPRSHYRTGRHAGKLKPNAPEFCSKRPDLDKLLRALGDALTGIAVYDDAQLAEVEAVKAYGSPGLSATVYEIGEP